MFRNRATCLALLFSCVMIFQAHSAYDGEYALSSYSMIFHSPGSISNSYGVSKEIFTEFSDLIVQTNNIYTIEFNETSMQRTIFDAREYGTENLVYNAYTNQLTTITNASEEGAWSPGANNTVEVQTEDGSASIFFNTSTNAALVFMTDENGSDYEEAGIAVIVRKTAGLSNADLNGTYVRYTIGNENSGVTPRGWGNTDSLYLEQSLMDFNGDGTYTEQLTEWAAHRIITENIITNEFGHHVDSFCSVGAPETASDASTNSYAVSSTDGRMQITTSGGDIATQMSADGNLIVTALGQADGDSVSTYFVAAVKQPSNMSTNPIDAVYFTAEIDEEFGWSSPTAGNNHNSCEVGRSYIFMKSDGTFTMRSDYWSIGNTLDNLQQYELAHGILSFNYFTTESEPRIIDFSGGTYSITSNGVVTLAFDSGDMGMAQISENGQYVVYGFPNGEEGYAERFMGIGIKRDAPPEAASQVVFNNDFTMTPTGGLFSVSLPTDTDVEILHTADLSWGDWNSLGTTNSPASTLQIRDTDAGPHSARFYTATFGIW